MRVILLLLLITSCNSVVNKTVNVLSNVQIGDSIDNLNNVTVYYNSSIGNVSSRNITVDGYNLGLKYQCVEFVKRYYYEYYNHKMPNTYGNAKDFFNKSLKDGEINVDRNLTQYKNGSKFIPRVGDLVVFDGHTFNPYGHVAIISKVVDGQLEVIQQNCASTRQTYSLYKEGDIYLINYDNLLGYLRKNKQ